MRYEWDEAKNRSNIAKHGFDFADAARVLTARCITFVDNRFEYGEERFISIGMFKTRVVVIAHTLRGLDVTRIISMRKANGREQKIYQDRLGPH